LAEAKQRAKAKLKAIVTDGLITYEDIVKKEFFTLKAPRIKHVMVPSIKDKINNNVLECFHGTIRERGMFSSPLFHIDSFLPVKIRGLKPRRKNPKNRKEKHLNFA